MISRRFYEDHKDTGVSTDGFRPFWVEETGEEKLIDEWLESTGGLQ
ncbi:MAG: hypothetical protein ACOC5D_05830 [Thermoplasmatota archaeon]